MVFNSRTEITVRLFHRVILLQSFPECTVQKEPHNAVISVSRYSIHLWDLKHPGTWENKGTYVYYTDFIMELAMLFLDLVHHIHMLVRQCFWVFFLNFCFWLSYSFMYVFFLSSCLETSGSPWQVWLSLCSCDISSTRSSAECAGTKTTFALLIIWRPGWYKFSHLFLNVCFI